MHADVEGLLILQVEDDLVEVIRTRIDAMAPRLAALDTLRDKAQRALNQLTASIDADEKKRRDLTARLADHKERHEKNVAQLDVVKRMREATAAVAQVEMGRKVLLELEGELKDLTNRLTNARQTMAEQDATLTSLAEEQAAARATLSTERAALDKELASAVKKRENKASNVTPSIRVKYDKIRSRRRSQTVFSLVSGACGACDTAIPVQRRTAMTISGAVELCEGCGVLIYAKG